MLAKAFISLFEAISNIFIVILVMFHSSIVFAHRVRRVNAIAGMTNAVQKHRFGYRGEGTYCQLEKMMARCRWNNEVIVMTSAIWGRMEANRCLNIHPNVLSALGHDPQFLGCFQDVLPLLHSKCSGRTQCEVRIPDADLDQMKPCYHDLKSYLTASYSCVKVMQQSHSCVVSVTREAQFISSSSWTSSDVNSGSSSCGSKSHPWRLEAASGQRINISLLDFTAMSMSAQAAASNRGREGQSVPSCRQYGYVLDKSNKKNVSVCAGGGAKLRQSHVYLSHSNNVEIVQSPIAADKQHLILIRVEAVGCTNMIPPENAWLRRSDNDIIIGCYSSQQTWQLTCDGREWKGFIGTCPELYSGSLLISEEGGSETTALVVMMITTAAALILCITIVSAGCIIFKRRTDASDTKILNMPNSDSADEHPRNSECAENNKSIVNSAIFTRPLPEPVSNEFRHLQTQTQAHQHRPKKLLLHTNALYFERHTLQIIGS